MRRHVIAAAVLALVSLQACGRTDRPEGVVERWLVSLNQGSAGRPETYAPDALSERILPRWSSRDPGDLDVIEVGKGTEQRQVADGGDRSFLAAYVPYRVKRVNGPALEGVAYASRERGDWRVTALLPPGTAGLSVPTNGGRRIGSASWTTWVAAAAAAAMFIVIAGVLMATVGRRRTAAAA